MSSSYAPTGKARQVDGGYRLDGRWSFSSGCDHASWVLLGGIVTNDEDGALYLRMDDFPARLVIVPGSAERLLASGWEVADPPALAAVGRALADAGAAVKAGTADELAARRVASMLRLEDPAGPGAAARSAGPGTSHDRDRVAGRRGPGA